MFRLAPEGFTSIFPSTFSGHWLRAYCWIVLPSPHAYSGANEYVICEVVVFATTIKYIVSEYCFSDGYEAYVTNVPELSTAT